MPFGLTNILTGKKSLERIRDKAFTFADEMYGGKAESLQPIKDLAGQRAVEGLGEGTRSRTRERGLSSLSRPIRSDVFGGDQSRAIAGAQAQTESINEGMVNIETDLAFRDEEVRRTGEDAFARTSAEQKSLFATRDAAKTQAQMDYEAELSARRSALGAVALQAGITAFSPGDTLNNKIKGLFGEEVSEELSESLPDVVDTLTDNDLLGDKTEFSFDLSLDEEIPTTESTMDRRSLDLSQERDSNTLGADEMENISFVRENFDTYWNNFQENYPANASFENRDELFQHYMDNPDLFRDILNFN